MPAYSQPIDVRSSTCRKAPTWFAVDRGGAKSRRSVINLEMDR